jgi:RecA-family ATPase
MALGKLSLIAGEPGLGKSQLTAALAAAVTTSDQWPCTQERAPLGSVVIFSAEDDARDTIVPRLKGAGADLDRIRIVSGVKEQSDRGVGIERSFSLQADLPLLEGAIRKLGDARLIIIDPITSYLGKVDSHKNAEIRSVLEPVAQMAARHGAAVVGITHFSKGGGTSAINRFIGSIGFIAAARAAFVVTTTPIPTIPPGGYSYLSKATLPRAVTGSHLESSNAYSTTAYWLPASSGAAIR